MKVFILCMIFTFQAVACDWSTINRQENQFVYSSKCHLSVGKLVKTEELRVEQVESLKKSIELKDLAIQKADLRSDNWEKEVNNQFGLLQKKEKESKMNKVLYFGLGAATVLFSAWAIKQVR